MNSLLPIALVLIASTAYGIWYQRTRGRVVVKGSKKKAGLINAQMIGVELGPRVTVVQFSSAFCTPCRATRALISDVTATMDDVTYVEIDAEDQLELVRKLDIRSTPTTLFVDKKGNEVGRAMGAPKRAQVVSAIDAIR